MRRQADEADRARQMHECARQMDEVTQQHVALVARAAGTVRCLEAHAGALACAVAVFRLDPRVVVGVDARDSAKIAARSRRRLLSDASPSGAKKPAGSAGAQGAAAAEHHWETS